MSMILIVVGALLTGLGKAIRDTIAHHWERSIFRRRIHNMNLYVWFHSRMPRKNIIWFLRDAWHFADSVILFAGIVIAMRGFVLNPYPFWLNAGVFLLITGVTFQILYKMVFIDKNKRNEDD